MNLIKEFPKLFKKTSTGAIQQWEVKVFETDNGCGIITSYYGQVDGKLQESTTMVREGKNIGKSNETSVIEQAISDAESDWKKHLKKGYINNIEDASNGVVDNIIEGGIFPMLAHKFSEQGHKIDFDAGAIVQPKLDGHCCIDDNTIKASLWSRTRKPIKSVPHIVNAIEDILKIIKFDYLHGELYNHEYHANFEELSSFIRQEEPIDGCEVVQYHVYDFPHPTMTNFERYQFLESLRPYVAGTPIRIVESIIVHSEDEMMDAFDHFIELGYEGCMVRNAKGLYVNKRSYDLQKVKEFDDDEFKIVDIKISENGVMAGKAIFICELPNGETFDCKLKGNMDKLKEYADNPELVIGKILTVKYQGYTKYGKPRFGVGLRFREDI